MDFSGSAGAASSFDLIPAGVLVFANLTVRGLKGSASGGKYIDCELTVDAGQPYAGRKVWEMIGDPHFAGNTEGYRQMGTIAITRILEAGRGAGPNNMAGYVIRDDNQYADLNGLRVPIKLKIENGTGGFDDKNKVAEWLTPNPASQSGYKDFARLIAGDHGLPNAKPAGAGTQTGFGGFGGAAAAVQEANGNSGFGGAGAASGFSQPAGETAGSSSTTSTTTSPSDQPAWLQQAQG